MIIGLPGAGKSVFARRLGKSLGIQVFHSDEAYWSEGWTLNPSDVHRAMMYLMVNEESWIIDGELRNSFDIWSVACDRVIWLDPPVWLRTFWLLYRWLRYRGKSRPGMAAGCPEQFDRIAWVSVKGPVAVFERQRLERLAEQLGDKLIKVRRGRQVRF